MIHEIELRTVSNLSFDVIENFVFSYNDNANKK